MKRSLVALIAIVICAGSLVACGGSSVRPNLTGGIRFVGRTPPGYTATGYQRGLVQILGLEGVIASTHLAQGQGYRFALRPGAYEIRTWGNAKPSTYPPCAAKVRIRAGRTSHVNVICDFH